MPGALLPMRLVTSVLSFIATPSILRITSPALNPAFAAGPSGSTVPTSAPFAVVEAEALRERLVDALDADAEAAVLHLAAAS